MVAGSTHPSPKSCFTNIPAICGTVVAMAGAFRFLFFGLHPDYRLDYDLYPSSVQVLTSLALVAGVGATLGAWWFCFSGKAGRMAVVLCAITIPFVFYEFFYPKTTVTAVHHRRVADMDKMRELSYAFQNYHWTNKHFPPVGSCNGECNLSWRVHILPYIGFDDLYQRFRLDEPWNSPHNMTLIDEMPELFSSRSYKSRTELGKTVFLCPVGNGALFTTEGSHVCLENILDGGSNTSLMVQVDRTGAVVWTKPADYDFDPFNPVDGLGLEGYFLASTCDGVSHAISIDKRAEVVSLMTVQNRVGDD